MRIEIVSLSDVERWRGLLAQDERTAAAGKINPTIRIRFEITRGLRRKMLAEESGINAADLCFAEEDQGKPRVLNVDGWDFNLSHAGDFVACAVARGQVGVDIEQIRPVRDVESIVDRYFHQDEAAAWRALSPGLREEAFFVLWSAREAAVKCTGRGLAKGLSITRVDPAILGKVEASAHVGGAELRLRRLEAPQGYVAVVAQGAAG